MLGIVLSLTPDYAQARTWIYPATDFRVLLSATSVMAHGHNPYNMAALGGAYSHLGWPVPPGFVSRAPVYPPWTLAMLIPLLVVSGVAAQWTWLVLNAAALSLALTQLLRWTVRHLDFNLLQGYALVVIAATVPMVAFALDIGNLSVMAASCCVAAFCLLEDSPFSVAILLALALLMKPQLAIVCAIAFAFVGGRRGRVSVAGAFAIAAVAASLVCLLLDLQGRLLADVGALSSLLKSEQALGSMSPGFLEILPVFAQITTLTNLLALTPLSVHGATIAVIICAALGAALLWAGFVIDWRSPASASVSLLYVSAWVAEGLLASYHRAHDALVMLLVLPWLIVAITRRRQVLAAVAVVLFGVLLTVYIFRDTGWMAPDANGAAASTLRMVLFYRTAAIADLGLALTLTYACAQAARALSRAEQAKKDAMNDGSFMAGGQ